MAMAARVITAVAVLLLVVATSATVATPAGLAFPLVLSAAAAILALLLLLERRVRLLALDSAKLVGVAATIATRGLATVALLPVENDRTLDHIDLELLNGLALADELGDRVHRRRELREEDHRLHVAGELALRRRETLEVRLDLIQSDSRMSVGGDVRVQDGFELRVDRGDAGLPVGRLESRPDLVGSRLGLDLLFDRLGETKKDVAHGASVRVRPRLHLLSVAVILGEGRLLRAVDSRPLALRHEEGLHDWSPRLVVRAVENGDERLEAVGHVEESEESSVIDTVSVCPTSSQSSTAAHKRWTPIVSPSLC